MHDGDVVRLPADVELRVTRLRLAKEHLTELTTEDLHRVAGGDTVGTVAALCATVTGCPTMRTCTTFPSCGCDVTDFC